MQRCTGSEALSNELHQEIVLIWIKIFWFACYADGLKIQV
jgi:hypothetical protein